MSDEEKSMSIAPHFRSRNTHPNRTAGVQDLDPAVPAKSGVGSCVRCELTDERKNPGNTMFCHVLLQAGYLVGETALHPPPSPDCRNILKHTWYVKAQHYMTDHTAT